MSSSSSSVSSSSVLLPSQSKRTITNTSTGWFLSKHTVLVCLVMLQSHPLVLSWQPSSNAVLRFHSSSRSSSSNDNSPIERSRRRRPHLSPHVHNHLPQRSSGYRQHRQRQHHHRLFQSPRDTDRSSSVSSSTRTTATTATTTTTTTTTAEERMGSAPSFPKPQWLSFSNAFRDDDNEYEEGEEEQDANEDGSDRKSSFFAFPSSPLSLSSSSSSSSSSLAETNNGGDEIKAVPSWLPTFTGGTGGSSSSSTDVDSSSTKATTQNIETNKIDGIEKNIESAVGIVILSLVAVVAAIGYFGVPEVLSSATSPSSSSSSTTALTVVSSSISQLQTIAQDPGAALEAVVDKVESMGPLGVAYFGIAYTVAEIFAIPAIPLTASAGYLFGPVQGTAVVLFSASIAAAVSFGIGRTLLREYVEGVLADYPKFEKLDKAIGKEGFKLMLLLRLSPIFPFALSNYLYGASSINFPAFFWGTVLGFAPGTIAYVYTGYVGKALTDGGTEAYPWYVYAGGLTLFAGLLKIIADVATRVVEEIEEEDGL